jgi:RNA polymerase sigma factor (sigma-70 family)
LITAANSYQDQQRLIRQCVAGDTSAYRVLYEQHARAMFNTSFRLLNNHADAEDVLQEAFTDAFRSLDRFNFDYTFGTWLKRIVINKSINHLRKQKRLPVNALPEAVPDMADDAPQGDETEWKAEVVRNTMNTLPEPYRTVLNLYLLEDYSQEEIGDLLGIAHGTVRVQYMRGKQKLLSLLKEQQLYGR